MTLVDHARYELERSGEDADVIDWYLDVVAAFARYGHSGSSARHTMRVLTRLLRFEPLTPLTNDPAEWMDIAEYSDAMGEPTWQSRRNPDAFSSDGGQSYYLLSDGEPRPMHQSMSLNRY